MTTETLTDYYLSAKEAVKANGGKIRPSWVQPIAKQDGDDIGIYTEERHAVLYLTLDENGNRYYTFVGTTPESYVQVEKWRIRHHKALLYMPQYAKEFDTLFRQYHGLASGS